MVKENLVGVNGWLLVYVIGSVPLLMIYSMGLSGWFLEYPFGLMVGLFIIFASPLLLILRKFSQAPRLNIIMWRSVTILMTLRSISIFMDPGSESMTGGEAVSLALTLLPIVAASAVWTAVWTSYFRKSTRVGQTFSS